MAAREVKTATAKKIRISLLIRESFKIHQKELKEQSVRTFLSPIAVKISLNTFLPSICLLKMPKHGRTLKN